MNLTEAIQARHDRIAQLQFEIEQLEKARELVEGILDVGTAMKPPPRVPKQQRKERAVRAEPKAEKTPGLCTICKKPIPPRKKGTPGRQKTAHPACRARA